MHCQKFQKTTFGKGKLHAKLHLPGDDLQKMEINSIIDQVRAVRFLVGECKVWVDKARQIQGGAGNRKARPGKKGLGR